MPTRREVLAGLGALAVGCARGDDSGGEAADPRTPEPDPWAGLGEADDVAFPVGVQSGDPLPDGAIAWTRYDGAADLTLIVAAWDGAWVEREVAVEVVDGFVHHAVGGLGADTPVAFQFRDATGALSPVGRFRTAIDADHTGTVVIGATSCCNASRRPFASLPLLAARFRMDAFLWLGDTVYADGAVTLEGYRAKWAENLGSEGFRAILAGTAGITTWDDHEVDNNWDPQTIDADLFARATRAYRENTAIRGERLWRSYRFGRTAEVFVLDCRSERRPSEDVYISAEQMAWLKAGLSASTAVWKVIANSVPISVMPPILASQAYDRWEGYPAQRDELLDHVVDEGIEGVLFVSGDLHQSSLSRVDPSGPRARIFEVQAGPSGASFLNVAARLVAEEGQWIWSDAQWCADAIELRSDGTARIVAVDEHDVVLFDGEITADGRVLSASIVHPSA